MTLPVRGFVFQWPSTSRTMRKYCRTCKHPFVIRAGGRYRGRHNIKYCSDRCREAALVARRHRQRAAEARAPGDDFDAVEWLVILDRSRGFCEGCGVAGVPLTVDHITPLAAGGSNEADNLRAVCQRCNSANQPAEKRRG